MIEGVFFLQSYGYFGGSAIETLFATWQQAGFFSHLLPFLLIFALLYGILTNMKLFRGNKTIDAIIALSVSLMALQFDFVPRFFSEVFPRLGIGLVILLLVIILTGLFSNPSDKWMMYLPWGIGFVIVIVILVQTAQVTGWYSFLPWLGYNWPMVLGVAAFFIMIAIVVGSARPKSTTPMDSPWSKMLHEMYKD